MEYGKLEHVEIQRLEKRRSLKAYGILEGERAFQIYLESTRLGMHGILDMMIITREGSIYPVDFKHSISPRGLHQKYQIAAYAMLLEDKFLRPVRYGFIYLIPLKTIVPVEITSSMRDHVKKTINAIRKIAFSEKMPGYVRSKKRCTDCEYRNYCADLE